MGPLLHIEARLFQTDELGEEQQLICVVRCGLNIWII